MSNPWACWNCGHKISEVEIDCDINGRIAARFECSDFEPRKDSNDGWDLAQKLYTHCQNSWFGDDDIDDDYHRGKDDAYEEIMEIIDNFKGNK